MNTNEFFELLDDQNKADLSRKSGLSRQAVFDALKTRNFKLQTLKRVARNLNLEVSLKPLESEGNVLASLAKFGSVSGQDEPGTLDLEESLAAGLFFVHSSGLLESLLPYVLALNAKKLNVTRLFALSLLREEAATLGYLVGMASKFKPHANLEKLKSLCVPFKFSSETPLLKNQVANFPEILRKNDVAREWNVLARGTVKDHLDRWEKWQRSQKRRALLKNRQTPQPRD